MFDWVIDNLALIMFISMFFFIFIGYPVAYIMGGLSLIFALIGVWGGTFNLIGLSDVVLRMWAGVAADPVLASIPMFIFMGAILERSGSAKDMLDATEVLMKWCPGALAVSVMVMGTILAAPIGVVGAAVITLSVIALPQMLAAGYDKRLAIGTIASAGTLGILIPPAIMLVVMAEMLATSAGNLFLVAPSCRDSCCPASTSSTSSPSRSSSRAPRPSCRRTTDRRPRQRSGWRSCADCSR